jgi:hypothetical protein
MKDKYERVQGHDKRKEPQKNNRIRYCDLCTFHRLDHQECSTEDGVLIPGYSDDAAANGHLVVVKWLHANRNEGCTRYAMDRAEANGHLDVVRWLHENVDIGEHT